MNFGRSKKKYEKKRLFEIIEKSEGDDRLSSAYDIFMIIVITASLVPLAFKEENSFFLHFLESQSLHFLPVLLQPVI